LNAVQTVQWSWLLIAFAVLAGIDLHRVFGKMQTKWLLHSKKSGYFYYICVFCAIFSQHILKFCCEICDKKTPTASKILRLVQHSHFGIKKSKLLPVVN